MITKYYKVLANNGYCGCDIERCVEVNANSEQESVELIESYCADYWEEYRNEYADERFIDYPERDEYEDDDAYEEAYEEAVCNYEDDIFIDYYEVSKEDFLEVVQGGYEYETIGVSKNC